MQGTGHGQQTGATESDDMTDMTRKYQKVVFKVDLKGSDLTPATPEQMEKIR